MRKKIHHEKDDPQNSENGATGSATDDPPADGHPISRGAEDYITALQADLEEARAQAEKQNVSRGAEDYITALQADLEEARTRVEEAEKRALYVQADYQNFRRRKEEEFKDLQKYANGELIKALLPILDNFERALDAAERTHNIEALIGGITGTYKQLQTLLQKAGVTPIEAIGKEFDPRYHEAIGHTESAEYPANTVAEELQRGYLIHDRVLRPTLVKVSQD